MSEAFDPYRKWLGIPPEEQPPHHYRLLGIANFEDDPDVIENAADRQMSHVRTYQSGKHSAESQRLLNELSGAKLVLLSEEKRSAYDSELRDRLGQNGSKDSPVAPTPRRAGSSGIGSAGDAPAAPSPSKPAAKGPPAAPASAKAPPKKPVAAPPPAPAESGVLKGAPASVAPVVGGTATRRSVRKRRKNNSQVPLIVGGIIGAVVLLTLVVVVASSTSSSSGKVGKGTPSGSKSGGSKSGTSKTKAPDSDPASRDRPDSRNRPRGTRPDGRPWRNGEAETVDSGNNPGFPQGIPDPGENPFDPPVVPTGSPDELAEQARIALQTRDVSLAKTKLNQASRSSNDEELAAEIKQLDSLADYLESFWDAVKKGVRRVDVGDSVKVGDLDYVLKKRKSSEITYEVNGTERTSTFSELPAMVAIAFAREALDQDPYADLYVATFHAIDGDGQDEQRREWARKLWIQSANNGTVESVLAAELDIDPEPYMRGLARMENLGGRPNRPKTAVPTSRELSDDRREIKRAYVADFTRLRVDPTGWKELCRNLTTAARTEDNPIRKYVLYEEALELATKVPDVDVSLAAVNEIAKTYEIDLLAKKREVLADCLDSSLNLEINRQIFTEAGQFFIIAEDQGEYESAAEFGRVAERAARKSRDFAAADAAAAEAERMEDRVKHQKLAQRALITLKEQPDDPAANSDLGKYRCFYEGKWDEGLEYLAKGEPPYLELAKLELSKPDDAETLLRIADQWYDIARRESGDPVRFLLLHAGAKFEVALTKLKGDAKQTAETSLREIDRALEAL